MVARGVLRTLEEGRLYFSCPGCKMGHALTVKPAPSPSWSFNGNYDKPTFSPSILSRYTHWVPSAVDPEVAEKVRSGEIVQTKVEEICHSFVEDGIIRFLDDCTHDLRGQSVCLTLSEEDE